MTRDDLLVRVLMPPTAVAVGVIVGGYVLVTICLGIAVGITRRLEEA